MDMNEVKDLYQQGMIDKVCYRNYAVKATLHILDSGQCSVVGVLGSGTFGSVVEIQNKQTKVSLAAKIVVQHSVSESELVIWPKLSHPNILPLFAHKLYVDVHTYIFVMPKCPTSLSKMVHQLHFLLDPKALNRAVLWLEGILQGLSYLHGKRLCHLDIKPDNILIAGNDVAVLTDFGFTSSAEKFTTGYGSPMMYRAPEARKIDGHFAAVDGHKFDVWTVGLLALEMFTREGYHRQVCLWPTVSNKWTDQIYPTVHELLQNDNFLVLLSKAFPSTDNCEAASSNIVSLIISCLQLNPAGRPSAKELLQQKLFGGSRFTSLDESDIWHKKACAFEIETLIKMYKQLEENTKADEKFIESIQLPKVTSKRAEQSEAASLEKKVDPQVAASLEKKVDPQVAASLEKKVDPQVFDQVKASSNYDHAHPEGKRHKFAEWTKKKKVTLTKAFKSLMPIFRTSRR